MTSPAAGRRKRPQRPLKLSGMLADTQRTQINVRVTLGQLAALRQIQVRVGVPMSEQVRRGIGLWLESQEGGR